MSKPMDHKLLNVSAFILEVGLLWTLLQIQFSGTSISLGTILATLVIGFIFTSHCIAFTVQKIVPRLPLQMQNLALIFSVLAGILLALILTSGMIIGISYISGTA